MKTLYLGIDPPQNSAYYHYPLIKTVFREPWKESIEALEECSHLIFTSKNGIRAVSTHLKSKPAFAVGKQTAHYLRQYGFQDILFPKRETAEGLVELLDLQFFNQPYFVWPHSALSRTVISDYLLAKRLRFHAFIAYDTYSLASLPKPDLKEYEEIIFTSPSTVISFLEHFGKPPSHLKLTAIGPITAESILLNFLK